MPIRSVVNSVSGYEPRITQVPQTYIEPAVEINRSITAMTETS